MSEKIFEDELAHYGTPQLYPGDPHGSGRYREGSGDNPNQHGSDDFLQRVNELKKKGLSETEIAESFGMSTTQFRTEKSLAVQERRSAQVARARSLKEDGYNNVQIAEMMGLKGESTVRSLLNADSEARMKISEKLAVNLAEIVDTKGMVDVGVGTERVLGSGNISREKMNQALKILQDQGYEVYSGRMPQVTNPGRYTTIKVLCPPGTEHKEIYDYSKINSLKDYASRDGGDTFEPSFRYPASMDSKRLMVRYAEDGGVDKDGLIEIRRGVKDLSLGEANYAQVRILVDGTHYLKGMAVYNDNLPEGVDVLFNTNKTREKAPEKLDALKSVKKNLEKDPDNPFGSAIKEHGGQSYYDDPNGEFVDPVTGHKQSLSLINKRATEGDWNEWSDHLPSQFLSKQPLQLINRQLSKTAAEKQAEYDEIMSLTNPTVKRALLETFAEDCDAASVHLKAAALPGQKYQVILPLTSIGDNEVYAPNYKDGSQIALIRYPHGGTFEIPILTVNNRNKEGQEFISKNPKDAVGINSSVANRLSGADFDGDTVMVIPISDTVKIKSTHPLKGLKDFDTKLAYGADDSYEDENGKEHYLRGGKEYKIMRNTQTEMGIVSNLITDMTIMGAEEDELARAVRHSMVVIDAEKHKLDYHQSYIDNNIAALKDKYQGKINEATGKTTHGASTIISRAKSEVEVPERKEGAFFSKENNDRVTLVDTDNKIYYNEKTGEYLNKSQVKTLYIDPNTGEKTYHETGRTYVKAEYIDSKGKKQLASVIAKDGDAYYKNDLNEYVKVSNEKLITKLATETSTKMAEAKNAIELVSKYNSPKELAYADYANKLKSLANSARKESIAIVDIPYSASARSTYAKEYEDLKYKLNISLVNAPKERAAQTIANSIIKTKLTNSPEMSADQENKIRQQALSRARNIVGAKRTNIDITDKEWEAIQAGAITPSMLKQIIDNTDTDVIKKYAMPRNSTVLTDAKIAKINALKSNGYTTSEIADYMGISVSTIQKYTSKKE